MERVEVSGEYEVKQEGKDEGRRKGGKEFALREALRRVLYGRGTRKEKHTWKAPLRLTFFSEASVAESRSMPSSPLTFAELFFLRETNFFFVMGCFLLLPPLVDLPRRFSSACRRAAKAASSSTTFICLFFGVGFEEAAKAPEPSETSPSAGRF